MGNNNTEVITYITPTQIGSGLYSYDDDDFLAGFLTADTHQDQLEVVRRFSWDDNDGSRPTAEELKTVYTLPYEKFSGSPMYIINEDDKTIQFSTVDANYVWKNGLHHSRGSDIDLQAWSEADSITIRRKTPTKSKDQVWASGSKMTAPRLNAQFGQLLNIAQEIRAFLLNPLEFDTYVGTRNGICPLDGNAKVSLQYIPYSLGGTGSDNAMDVSEVNLSAFANVSSDSPSSTKIHLIWDDTAGKWTPNIPLTSLVTNLSTASSGDILQWTGSVWSLVTFELDDMADIDISSSNRVTGDLLYWDDTASRWKNTAWGSSDAPSENDVLMWVDGKWTPTAYTGSSITSAVLNEHSISECGDVSYFNQASPYTVNDTRHGDILSIFNYGGTGTDAIYKMKPKSVDIYDLNDVTTLNNDGGQLPSIEDGFMLRYDNTLLQNDDWGGSPAGCFSFGKFGSKTDNIDFDDLQTHDVLQINASREWNLAQLNIYHLEDILVGWSDVQDGDTFIYDAENAGWTTGPLSVGLGGDGNRAVGAAQYLTITKTYTRDSYYATDTTDGQDWFETFVWGGQNYAGGKQLIPVWYHIFGLHPTDTNSASTTYPAYEWLIKKTDFGAIKDGAVWDDFAWWKNVAPQGSIANKFSTNQTEGSTPYPGLTARRNIPYGESESFIDRAQWIGDGILYENDVLVFRPRYHNGPIFNGHYMPMCIQLVFEVVTP